MFGLDKLGTRIVGGLLVALALCLAFGIYSCSRQQASTSVTKATQRNDVAKDKAAEERRSDDAQILSNQQERTDAINAAPKGETGPATRALACRRWVLAHPSAPIPSQCRPSS